MSRVLQVDGVSLLISDKPEYTVQHNSPWPSPWWRHRCVECHNQRFMPRGTYLCLYCQGPESLEAFKARRRTMGYLWLTRLRELRLERGMTQNDLAELSGITVSTISGNETARHGARLGTAKKLAAALGTTIEDLRGAA